MENLFIQATRNKARFAYKGTLSVEDLWDLKVQDLDAIYQSLDAQLEQVQKKSLLNTRSTADKELEAKIEIVKYIVEVKLGEQQARLDAKAKAEKRQELLSILASKKAEELQGKSAAEIEQMLADLEK